MAKAKEKALPKKNGRPTIFTQELADLICERVATHSIGLRRLCEMFDDMPVKDTINQWRWKHDKFSAQYAKAKMMQAELGAEECIEIADDATNDWMKSLSEEEQGNGWKINGEHIQRSRLRVDTRKWVAAKLAPKIYGNTETKNINVNKHEERLDLIGDE